MEITVKTEVKYEINLRGEKEPTGNLALAN